MSKKRVTFIKDSLGGWFHLLPSLSFWICGPRRGGNYFPFKFEGVQASFCWLLFEIFFDFSNEDYIEDLWE